MSPCKPRSMADSGERAYGPSGDASRHLPLAALEAGLRALLRLPSDRGQVTLLVSRRADGIRETPEHVVLTPEGGMPGDAWSRRLPLSLDGQLAVMRREVAEVIANGQPLTVFGDNLLVDLDLAASNLPIGSRLRVGAALVEMTPKAHDGCAKFMARFGQDALRLVSARPTRDQNFRGVYWKVVSPGGVRVGDAVEIVSRPSTP